VMNLSSRVWKRIKAALIDLGKIVCRNGALTNSRFETERRKRADEMRKKAAAAEARWGKKEQTLPEVSSKFAGSLGEVLTKFAETDGKKVNEINETSKNVHMESVIRNPISEIRNQYNSSDLMKMLLEAGGPAIADEAKCRGIANLGEVHAWLGDGCDLELDILPAIRAGVVRMAPNDIRTWSYFRNAVRRNKENRERPAPEAGTSPQPAKRGWVDPRVARAHAASRAERELLEELN
jgi:hypothetical protein